MTAETELKLYFEQQLRIHLSNEIKYTTEKALLDAIEICENCINTKEKQQIIEAHNKGENILPPNESGQQYYNETFKNK